MSRAGTAAAALWCGIAAIAAASALGWLGALAWWIDLFAHFRLQYFVGAALCLVLALTLQRRRAAALALLLAAINAVPLAGTLTAVDAAHATAPSVRVFSHNLLAWRDDPAATYEQAFTQDADVVALFEVREPWPAPAPALTDAYPYRTSSSVPFNGEVGWHRSWVYSRRPIGGVVELRDTFEPERTFAIRFELAQESTPLIIYAVHMQKNNTAPDALRQAAQRRILAEAVAREDPASDILVVGDMNTTPYAHAYRDMFPDAGKLRRAMSGIQATWPAMLGPFGIPIDHVMVSANLSASTRTLPARGSDHRAVLADVQRLHR